ncbi:hypothetical protein THASP1DRAFT_8484, partial [Thamnocephalis sphaerospora]
SFARLLRTSRLATYDPRIPQVYTTFGRHRHVGDWGLKRNLPTTVRTNVITVQALDTAEHQTPFDSAQGQIWQLERWKEAFPESRPPRARDVNPPVNVQRLKASEWRRFVRKAETRKNEWRTAVRSGQAQPDEHLRFLNATYQPATETGERTVSSIAVGPWYDWHQPEKRAVRGRALNRVTNGYAVGVGGIVALLPLHKALTMGALTPVVNTFYIDQMNIDENGRPEVQLSLANTSRPFSSDLSF